MKLNILKLRNWKTHVKLTKALTLDKPTNVFGAN